MEISCHTHTNKITFWILGSRRDDCESIFWNVTPCTALEFRRIFGRICPAQAVRLPAYHANQKISCEFLVEEEILEQVFYSLFRFLLANHHSTIVPL
jgi:hypothetical protein